MSSVAVAAQPEFVSKPAQTMAMDRAHQVSPDASHRVRTSTNNSYYGDDEEEAQDRKKLVKISITTRRFLYGRGPKMSESEINSRITDAGTELLPCTFNHAPHI